jgi:acyl dehydratase
MGIYFDGFAVGDVVETTGRTVTEYDLMAFAGLSGDFNPQHVDEQFAATTHFGTRIPNGLLGLIFTSGFLARAGLFDRTAVAFLGLTWEFVVPLRIGDTVRVRQTVRQARVASDGRRGIVDFGLQLINQHGQVAQQGTRKILLHRDPALLSEQAGDR